MDPHKLLQVEQGCTRTELDRRFRDLCKMFHPDRMGGDPTACVVFQLIQEAYQRLKAAGSTPPPIVLSRASNGEAQGRSNDASKAADCVLGARLTDPFFNTPFPLEAYFADVPLCRKK